MKNSSGSPLTGSRKGAMKFATVFKRFRRILFLNNRVLEKIAEMERALGGEYIFDHTYLNQVITSVVEGVREVIYTLNALASDRYVGLYDQFTVISDHLTDLLTGGPGPVGHLMVLDLKQIHRDLDHLVGAKNANLGEIRAHFGLQVPNGFAVTTTAYNRFMEANNLFEKIRAILDENNSVEEQAPKIRELFNEAALPLEIEKAIGENVARIEEEVGDSVRFAVRSSAVGEDGKRSFAGQFLSLLDIPAAKVPEACIQVMGSRFTPHLLRYLEKTADVTDVPVSVGIQVMVAAEAAGVVYTRDPGLPDENSLSVAAVSGTGGGLVGGRKEADQYTLGREYPFPLLRSKIKAKVFKQSEGGKNDPTDPAPDGLRRGSSILNLGQLHEIIEAAMLLEKNFEGPQDIEWAFSRDGRLVILQCRPLKMAQKPLLPEEELVAELHRAPLIMADRGHVVQLGVAAGQVVAVTADTRPEDFPLNAIAVCRYASPQISEIVRRAAAVITDIGSPTGHLATIAREFRTPALFGTVIGTQVLTNGMEVTVDVEEKKVYDGIIPGLLSLKLTDSEPLADYPEMRILRRLLRLIAPLTLIDPADPDFREENCRTFHDILRFCHEKAVETLINLNSAEDIALQHERGKILDIPIPIRLRVIDLGGGAAEINQKDFVVDNILSRPFNALLRGMLNQEAWNRESVPFGFKDLMTSITRPMATMSHAPLYTGENLAIIAENYCNLSLRLGYHFNVIDAYVADDPDDNYIYFRFVGGMAEEQKRTRRVDLIAKILTSLHFRIERQGDLLVGKVKMLAAEHMESILISLGELVAFTRQLDVRMVDDDAVERLFAQFLSRAVNGWHEQVGP
jgi:pyruvate,water dikinase